MTDKQIHSLSRRQLLGGVGAIGVASAGAGLGTTAYFSDEESFDDNTLSAGELDLLVDYELSYDQGSAGSGGTSGTINGDVQVVDETATTSRRVMRSRSRSTTSSPATAAGRSSVSGSSIIPRTCGSMAN